MWIWAWAGATPLDVDRQHLDQLTQRCVDEDAAACLQLADVTAVSWAQSVFGSAAGHDTLDLRRWRAHNRYVRAACDAGSGDACWYLDDPDQACRHDERYCPAGKRPAPAEPRSPCRDELRDGCPPPQELHGIPLPASEPFAFGAGWLGLANGRLYPRDVRPELLVEGASEALPTGPEGFVFAGTMDDHSHSRPNTLSLLTAEGWNDVVLELGDEGICGLRHADEEAVLVKISQQGKCTLSRRFDWVFRDGKMEQVPSPVDVAGRFSISTDAQRRITRHERGGAAVLTPLSGPMGRVSSEGHVAVFESGWKIWSDGNVHDAPAVAGKVSDWSRGHLFSADGEFLSKMAPDGTVVGTWTMPNTPGEFRVHPNGNSFWMKSGEHGDRLYALASDTEAERVPEWTADSKVHRVPWPAPKAPEAPAFTVTLDGAPVEGAFGHGQYTGADGKLKVLTRLGRRATPTACAVQVQGICRYGIVDPEAQSILVAPAVPVTFPDGRSRSIQGLGGPVKVAYSLGNGEMAVVTEKGGGEFVTGARYGAPKPSRSRPGPPLVEPVYTGTVEGTKVTLTAHPRVPLAVVDEAGLLLAGATVYSQGAVPHGATTDLSGRIELRDGDSAPLAPPKAGGEVSGPVDGVVTWSRTRSAEPPLAAGEVPAVSDLYGPWKDTLAVAEWPEMKRVWTFTPFQRGVAEPAGRTLQVYDDRTLVILDSGHLVGGMDWHASTPRPRAFERLDVDEVENTGSVFTGVFGWKPGDRVERRSGMRGEPETIDRGTVATDPAGLKLSWVYSALGSEVPMRARTVYLHPKGWFVGIDGDDADDLEGQLADAGAGRAGLLVAKSLGTTLVQTERAIGEWEQLVQLLIGRQLQKGVSVNEVHLDHEDEETMVQLTYLGREKCALGKCGRVRVVMGTNPRETIEMVVEPTTLRPVWRSRAVDDKKWVETWKWSNER